MFFWGAFQVLQCVPVSVCLCSLSPLWRSLVSHRAASAIMLLLAVFGTSPQLLLEYLSVSSCVGTLAHMRHLVGALEYISSWRWSDSDSDEKLITVQGARYSFPYTELPLRGHYECSVSEVSLTTDYHLFGLPAYSRGQILFPSSGQAFEYWLSLCKVDLMLRGFRDARLQASTLKLEANSLLLQRVLTADRHELSLLEVQWKLLNRPSSPARQWSEQQQAFLDHVFLGVSLCMLSL